MMSIFRRFIILLSFLCLTACAETELASHVVKQIPLLKPSESKGTFKVGKPYKIQGKWYHPKESYSLEETGIASWYGPNFHGKPTANGEIFNQNELTAAHRTLQLPSLVRVTNLENGRSLIVRVNDRGPFSKGRIIDLSKKAAELLGFKNQGTAKVKLQVLQKESREIAQIAQSGRSTAGTEIAANRNHAAPKPQRRPEFSYASAQHSAQAKPRPILRPVSTQQPITKIQLDPLTPSPVKGHITRGSFYPDPIVQQIPVEPSTIYVQTGSFADKVNATQLAQDLKSYGTAQIQTASVSGKTYYRVRIPTSSVPEADTLLARLSGAGKTDALIIVE